MKYLYIAAVVFLACGVQKDRDVVTEKADVPHMNIAVKDYGTIVIELLPEAAPNNVKNIIELSDKGFYNNLIFHRVIKGFVIQGGCPNGNGTGDPGYEIEDEISPKGKHLKGTVAMANRGPNTNGSQFYICLEPQPRLDGRYTIFGRVVQGMDVVDRIGEVRTGQYDKPLVDVVMERVWIEK
ncbi:MAG: peptidylprolyl isomerase [candidate division WOR-3 bacterium]|nr:MAG: peptidylprolyl isomerase [candidate division WOR-3 bacterium]